MRQRCVPFADLVQDAIRIPEFQINKRPIAKNKNGELPQTFSYTGDCDVRFSCNNYPYTRRHKDRSWRKFASFYYPPAEESEEPHFEAIKKDPRSHVQDTAITADTLLPGGPYDLWKDGETSRRIKDLAGAFAQLPHLPKCSNRRPLLKRSSTAASKARLY
jgi:hypothetical protein